MASIIYKVKPGERVNLKKIPTDATGNLASKEEARAKAAEMWKSIAQWQTALYAEHKRSLLIVFQAMDTGGKDGATRNLLTDVEPAGIHVTNFKAPTEEELSHDFLWRCHKATPAHGFIGVWNRSHYEDVLIVRVHNIIDKKTCLARYEDINAFERLLTRNRTTILKFFLHISKDEQKERLEERRDNPKKHWKFNVADLKERAYWDEYQKVYEDAMAACSTEVAPWHIVSGDHKWARDVALAETVLNTLKTMNPQYPKGDFDPKEIVIE